MKPTSINLNDEQLIINQKGKSSYDYRTGLEFLKTHNGLRKGKMHVLMAPSSGGKSTLVKSIIVDFCKNNPALKVLTILSEETVEEFKMELSDIKYNFNGQIDAISEIEIELAYGRNNIPFTITETIGSGQYSLVIYDNITTSVCYNDKTPNEQQNYVISLERRKNKEHHALLIVAHSGKKANKNFLDIDDIRGTSNLSNRAQFFYILSNFVVDNKFYQYVSIEKCRGFNRSAYMFFLKYDYNERYFTSCVKKPRKEVLEFRKMGLIK